MDVIVTAIEVGVVATLVMDLLNFIFSRFGIISKIDVRMIGRMAAGWTYGRFFYGHPNEMKHVRNEVLFGYITHYAIGISLSLPYVLGWNLLIGEPVS